MTRHHESVPHRFERGGAVLVADVFASTYCAQVSNALTATLQVAYSLSRGRRDLLIQPWCQALATQLAAHPQVQALLPADAIAIQCNYFEKTAANNWAVALHQDTMIPVAAWVAHPALKAWSIKQGQHFVQAPHALLAQMVALRLHLDDCTADNGALRVLPGSHRRGILSSESIKYDADETIVCTANAGDVWAMRPLVLHASSRASVYPTMLEPINLNTPQCDSNKRRVLHLVFAPPQLPYGLRWS